MLQTWWCTCFTLSIFWKSLTHLFVLFKYLQFKMSQQKKNLGKLVNEHWLNKAFSNPIRTYNRSKNKNIIFRNFKSMSFKIRFSISNVLDFLIFHFLTYAYIYLQFEIRVVFVFWQNTFEKISIDNTYTKIEHKHLHESLKT